MANTPRYSFVQPPIFAPAIQGGMTALGGIIQEKKASEDNQKRLNAFADTLQGEGLVADASIYRSLAAADTPNYMNAAITGKATARNLDMPFDHALDTIKAQQNRQNALEVAGIRSAGGGNAMTRTEFAARNSTISEDVRATESNIKDLRERKFDLQNKMLTASNLGYTDEVRLLKGQIAELDAEIERMGIEKNRYQEGRKNLTDNFFGAAPSATGASTVPQKRRPGYENRADPTWGEGVAFEPSGDAAGAPSGEVTNKAPTEGGGPSLFYDSAPVDSNAGMSLEKRKEALKAAYPGNDIKINAPSDGRMLDAIEDQLKKGNTGRVQFYQTEDEALAAGEQARLKMANAASYDTVPVQKAPDNWGFRISPKRPDQPVFEEGYSADELGYMHGPDGKVIRGDDGAPVTATQFQSDMRTLSNAGVNVPERANPTLKSQAQNIPSVTGPTVAPPRKRSILDKFYESQRPNFYQDPNQRAFNPNSPY